MQSEIIVSNKLMKFKIWILENMESGEDIFRHLSSIISSAPDYKIAIQNLSKIGVVTPRQVDQYSQLGHRWSESFYEWITGDKGHDKRNPELDKKLANLNSQILSLGFPGLEPDQRDAFYFFGIPGYKPDGAKLKIHVKIPAERAELLLDLAHIIKNNLSYVRQFKFSELGGGFESRRDNFIIYLSKQGEENINDLIQKISSLGLSTDIGEDFKGKSGKLSQTQLLSLRLAAILVSKSGSPEPKYSTSSHWNIIEKEFLSSDPIGSRYLVDSKTTDSMTTNSKTKISTDYQPKTLEMSTKNKPLGMNIDTKVGRYLLKGFIGDDAKYFSDKQFEVKKYPNGWYLIPDLSATNKTTINGSIANGATKININDLIGVVGKSGKQIVPLRVTSV